MRIHHLNCVEIISPLAGRGIGHCLLLEYATGFILIDAGTGLEDVRHPAQRWGMPLVEASGIRLYESLTAFRQLENLGLDPAGVQHVVLTHLDPDHTGGLADFPRAAIHVSAEEYAAFNQGGFRYPPQQLAHQPTIHTYGPSAAQWMGLEARKVHTSMDDGIWLVPLPGHSLGHCGVAIQTSDGWIFHVGDAYYYRVEIERDDHPVSQLAAANAADNALRLQSLAAIRRLMQEHPEITFISCHDPEEWPG